MTTVLFTDKDSIYKKLGQNCYDITRDARTYQGSDTIIAHPPCRHWGMLKQFATPAPNEKELAIMAIKLIETNGGIIEHPKSSALWKTMNIPLPGKETTPDKFTILIWLSWFGYKAKKSTLLYIVGCTQKQLPEIPISFDTITHTVGRSIPVTSGKRTKKEVSKKERSQTPELLAKWLIKVSEIITDNKAKKHHG